VASGSEQPEIGAQLRAVFHENVVKRTDGAVFVGVCGIVGKFGCVELLPATPESYQFGACMERLPFLQSADASGKGSVGTNVSGYEYIVVGFDSRIFGGEVSDCQA